MKSGKCEAGHRYQCSDDRPLLVGMASREWKLLNWLRVVDELKHYDRNKSLWASGKDSRVNGPFPLPKLSDLTLYLSD